MFVPKSDKSVKVYEQKNAIQKNWKLGDYYITDDYYNNKMSGFTVEPGDIIVSCAGTIGETYILPKEIEVGIINQALMRMNIVKSVNLDYFMLVFDHILKDEARKNSGGTAIKNIPPFEVFKAMPIPLPPIEEQARIVARVDELMAKIDEYEKIEKQLVELQQAFPGSMKDAILQAAMQGKLTKQFESDSDIKDMISKLKLDKSLKEPEELPFDIPEKWRWLPIGSLGETLGTDSFSDGPFGSNLKKEHQINKPEVRIIQLSNIGETGWKDDNVKYTSFNHLDNVIPRCEIHPGDFVIAKMMPAGRTIEVPDLGTRITLGSDAMKFVPNKMLNKRYLLYAMQSATFLNQVYEGAHGITRVRTTLNGVKSYLLPLPPIEEQQRIVDKLDQLLPLCESLEKLVS